MDKVETFFRRLRETHAPGEPERIATVRAALLQGDALRSAASGRLADDMKDPIPSFFQAQHSAGELSADRQRALLHGIIAEGRRRQAMHDGPRELHSRLSSFTGFRLAASVLVVVLVTGTTLTVTAEASLPGDALYSVKTVILEPVVGVAQFTQEAQAAWAERRVERRLREAVALHVHRNDDTGALQIAAEGIERDIERVSRLARDIADEGNDEAALDLQADVEAALDAYDVTMRHVQKKQEEAGTPVTDVIRRTKRRIVEERRQSEERFIDSSPSLPTAVEERTGALQIALDDIREQVNKGTGSVLQEEAASLVSTAEKMLDDIDDLTEKQQNEEAFLRAESALRLMEEAENLLENSEIISERETIEPAEEYEEESQDGAQEDATGSETIID